MERPDAKEVAAANRMQVRIIVALSRIDFDTIVKEEHERYHSGTAGSQVFGQAADDRQRDVPVDHRQQVLDVQGTTWTSLSDAIWESLQVARSEADG
jgi:hypothetical protein